MLGYLPYKDALAVEEQLLIDKAKYEKSKETYVAYTNMLSLYEQMKVGDELTIHTNDNILKFFEELEKTLPSTVVIQSLASDDEQVVMTMTVDDKETAAGVINNIREFDSLMSVSVPSIKEVEETYNATDYAIYKYKQYLFEMGNGDIYGLDTTEEDMIEGASNASGIPIEELKTIEDFKVPGNMSEIEGDFTFTGEVAEDGSISYAVRRVQFTITGVYYPATVIAEANAESSTAAETDAVSDATVAE